MPRCKICHTDHALDEFARWPRYKRLYLNAFDRMQEERARKGKGLVLNDKVDNPTAQDIFDWWMEEPWIVGQMSMFSEDG